MSRVGAEGGVVSTGVSATAADAGPSAVPAGSMRTAWMA